MKRQLIAASILFAALALTGSLSAQIIYPDFATTAGLVINGSATTLFNPVTAATSLQLTAAVNSQTSAVWFESPQDVVNGFQSDITFRVTGPGADGMAFVLHGDPAGSSAIGVGGGELGYGGGANGVGPTPLLSVEIDTYVNNFGTPDLGTNELSVHVQTTSASPDEGFSIGRLTPATNMSDGMPHVLRVLYVPGFLQIYLDDLITPLLGIPYDFVGGGLYANGMTAPGLGLQNGCAWLGFTGATGGVNQLQEVISWFHTSFSAAPPEYQLNQPEATFTVDQTVGSGCAPTIVTHCVATPAALQFGSTLSSAGWELVISGGPLVSRSGGGLGLLDGQVVNLAVGSPLLFLNGIFLPNFLPFPGPISVPVTSPTPLLVSGQALFLDAAAPLGVRLSRATELHFVQDVTLMPGPTTDNSSITFDAGAVPLCWLPGGFPFFGQMQSLVSISSNGRLLFGPADDDFTPTVGEGLSDAPWIGFWADLDPAQGGSITASSPSFGVLRVDFSGVPHHNEAGTSNTYSIELDWSTGAITLGSLNGVQINPRTSGIPVVQLMGISPGSGGPATDPGPTLFSAGGSGTSASGLAMLYDTVFTLAGGAILPSLAPGTLNSITFTPSLTVVPGYVWVGS